MDQFSRKGAEAGKDRRLEVEKLRSLEDKRSEVGGQRLLNSEGGMRNAETLRTKGEGRWTRDDGRGTRGEGRGMMDDG